MSKNTPQNQKKISKADTKPLSKEPSPQSKVVTPKTPRKQTIEKIQESKKRIAPPSLADEESKTKRQKMEKYLDDKPGDKTSLAEQMRSIPMDLTEEDSQAITGADGVTFTDQSSQDQSADAADDTASTGDVEMTTEALDERPTPPPSTTDLRAEWAALTKLGWKLKIQDLKLMTSVKQENAGREFILNGDRFVCWVDDKKPPNPAASTTQRKTLIEKGWDEADLVGLELSKSQKEGENKGRQFYRSYEIPFLCWVNAPTAPIRRANDAEVQRLVDNNYVTKVYDQYAKLHPNEVEYENKVVILDQNVYKKTSLSEKNNRANFNKFYYVYMENEEDPGVFLCFADSVYPYRTPKSKLYYMRK